MLDDAAKELSTHCAIHDVYVVTNSAQVREYRGREVKVAVHWPTGRVKIEPIAFQRESASYELFYVFIVIRKVVDYEFKNLRQLCRLKQIH